MSKAGDTRRPIGGTHATLTDEQRKELDRLIIKFSGHLFTPRLRNGRRIGIVLDCASYSQVRGRRLGNRGVVTDLNTGNQYEIAGAACSIPQCACDAIAIKKSFYPNSAGAVPAFGMEALFTSVPRRVSSGKFDRGKGNRLVVEKLGTEREIWA